MKKALVVLLVSAGCITIVSAQNVKESEVPAATKAAF